MSIQRTLKYRLPLFLKTFQRGVGAAEEGIHAGAHASPVATLDRLFGDYKLNRWDHEIEARG